MGDSTQRLGMQIAIYGKGGIGKSTVSSNISYNLSQKGLRTLQIGCDPKHDSTRALLKGTVQSTTLETMKSKESGDICLEDLVKISPCGVECIESGGPEPGIGCAGRGIITAMNELKRLGLDRSAYDVTLYDVLGDVVCGGFAVPLRRGFADVIYLVTSGEFMAVYAANNILRGILNHSPEVPRVGGIIFNSRGMEDELDLVERFSDAVGVPIICTIPRDKLFAEAERQGMTVSELYPKSMPAEQFRQLADKIIIQIQGKSELYPSNPLSDEELDRLLKNKPIRHCRNVPTKAGIKKSNGEACAARAAAMSLSGVRGLTVIIHGPRACGYAMCNIRDVHFLGDEKINRTLDRTYTDDLICTDMNDEDSIFGGISKLEKVIEEQYFLGKRNMAVVTACIPGIIGDDVGSCIAKMKQNHPDLEILDVRTDGNLTGSAFDGIKIARSSLLSMVDSDVQTEKGLVNIIASSGMNGGPDKDRICELLESIGCRLNTILFNGCTVDEIRGCRKAELNIPLSERDLSPANHALFESRGIELSEEPFPCGVHDTIEWLENKRNATNTESIDRYIDRCMSEYSEAVRTSSKILSGKRIYLIGWLSRPMDWVVDAMKDVGASVIRASMSGPVSGEPLKAERNSDIPSSPGSTVSEILQDLKELEPDLVLGGLRGADCLEVRHCHLPPSSVSIGASTDLLKYASNVMRAPVEASWKQRCCQ